MKTKKARSATIILILLLLLSGLSNISNAENILIDEEGLSKIGLNKIRMENGIGVLVFNLTTSANRLEGDGYLTVSNTFNSSATISCRVVTKLSCVDLDVNGDFRVHKKISETRIIKPVPDDSWITLEDDKAVIEPYSIYNFRYTVSIPLNKENQFNDSEGYLLYIHFNRDMGEVSGVNIGIDYNYKLFLIFTGIQEQEENISPDYLLISVITGILIIVGIVSFVLFKKKKHKEVPQIPSQAEINKVFPTVPRKKVDDTMRQKIDMLTKKQGEND